MCEPMSIMSATGLALGAAGMVANQASVNKQAAKRKRVAAAERARQSALEAESRAEFGRVLPQVGAEGTQAATAEAQARRTAEGEAAVTSAPNPAMPAAGSAPTVINDSYSRAMSAALRRGLERARAQAAVGAYGDAGLGNNIALARSGQEQARIGTAAQRSSQIFPMEMEAANSAGGGLRALGSGLSLAGQVAGAAGASGMGPSWGSIFGNGGWGNYTHAPIVGASGRIVGGL